MAKKIVSKIKLNLSAGEATPAPPVGPVLGQHGIPIMDFVKQYNAETADKKGSVIPVEITVYEDRSFDFITKLPPVADFIKKALKIAKGSGAPGRDLVGVLSQEQVASIAKEKMSDFNTSDPEAAKKIVIGAAKSMGVEVK
ncbi:MAG: 50S ribosomal protein L11 [Candidatus Shapirobacteria bacterium]|nr:50S ribosomal protein L11 [Candidatus Shapirobacteria bacterium]MDD5073887.1 50S ribosomal protein L11 [Candidatus Shapirobacteria bacterium]MDD5481480.1 50S ribosomal protein L11 [Candidatus Shapirobacteria bacterium]